VRTPSGGGQMDSEARILFAEADVRAERTVSTLRIAISLALSALIVAMAVFTTVLDNPEMERVIGFGAAMIAAYLGMGLFSAWIVRTDRYRLWMSVVFATADVMFVAANLYLGTTSIGLPVSLSAAFPAVWLVPIVVAFGALRYNAALQAYIVALFVLVLVLLLIVDAGRGIEDPEQALSTVTILFSVPPNVVRIAMIALAGGIMVLAAARSRRLIGQVITESRRRANLTRHLPRQVADRLADASVDALRRGDRRTVAVLFTDIRGFTGRSESMSPDALGEFVTEFRRRVTEAADAHDGVIDKFIGDAAMVVFGIPDGRGDEAARAISCGRAILAGVEEWNETLTRRGEQPVRVGVGAHLGEVFCGAVGDEARLEYTILGDTVNIAARLQDQTKAVGMAFVASAPLLQVAGGEEGWTSLGACQLRGRAQDIDIYGRND
jgi:adenylate cyclase